MDGVTGVRLRDTKTGALSELACDGVFIAIGHDPATKVFQGAVQLDDEGYIIAARGATGTSASGVFAAGDCVDKVFRRSEAHTSELQSLMRISSAVFCLKKKRIK